MILTVVLPPAAPTLGIHFRGSYPCEITKIHPDSPLRGKGLDVGMFIQALVVLKKDDQEENKALSPAGTGHSGGVVTMEYQYQDAQDLLAKLKETNHEPQRYFKIMDTSECTLAIPIPKGSGKGIQFDTKTSLRIEVVSRSCPFNGILNSSHIIQGIILSDGTMIRGILTSTQLLKILHDTQEQDHRRVLVSSIRAPGLGNVAFFDHALFVGATAFELGAF